jgi:2-C-methyl-D-erythritol 4-phosphate cytidylyltransferase
LIAGSFKADLMSNSAMPDASLRFYGLIPAAGSGERFHGGAHGYGGVPKQYQHIAGRPMLQHAIEAMLALPEISIVFVVLAPGDERFAELDLAAYDGRVEPLYCGGASRRDTVLNGLVAAASLLEPDDWVLVHDASRPCLGRAELRRLIDTVAAADGDSADNPGGILAVRVADTLKRGDATSHIVATESREGLWQAQTPQMFRYGTLIRALQSAPDATDEASAVERLGLHPKLVEGNVRNFKVTYAPDLDLAALLLQSGKE